MIKYADINMEGAMYYKIYLDGVELTTCYKADAETGAVWCYETDENGKLVTGEDGKVKRIRRTGKVEIVYTRENLS